LADAAADAARDCGTAGGAQRILLEGHVQGVGFRPFVARLARENGLTGYVRNCVGRVEVVACGSRAGLSAFREGLTRSAPPIARPRIVDCAEIEPRAHRDFQILASDAGTEADIYVPADNYLCDECRNELHDPGDRRHGYPFINCTQCGPRYTLIERMPYDRPNTSMAGFPLCAACRAEYTDEADRRFHAEPIACPDCGPQLSYRCGGETAVADEAVAAAVARLRAGGTIAVKGIGGYHLLCDALDEEAVARLRERKRRPDKPFAVMVPASGADGLDEVRRLAVLQPAEAAALCSPVRPVTLVKARNPRPLPASVAPGLDEYGLLLPYSPLHELLLERFGGPLVATSANVSGEPVLTEAASVETRLAGVADGFLHHDRPIVRPADDAVLRRIAGRARPLRLGRGNAPLELELPWRQPEPVIAVGSQMKTTVALSWGRRAVVSPHIGDMDSPRSLEVLQQVLDDLQRLYGVRAARMVCDAHPGYTTHRWARQRQPLPVLAVQHHRAHASALVAEAGLPGPWCVFTWDGVGFGDDGELWGGEAFTGEPGKWRRFASLRPFRLPGGERAGREPWRSAAGVFWACGLEPPVGPADKAIVREAHDRGINSPVTSAAGRLFDAAAAAVTGCQSVSFEAGAPMMLEALCARRAEVMPLPLAQDAKGVWRSDWEPLLPMLADRGRPARQRAERFHAALAGVVRDQALRARGALGSVRVGLCGGVFQNRLLTETAISLLEDEGFAVFLPSALPCNDAAISLGQVAELAARSRQDRHVD